MKKAVGIFILAMSMCLSMEASAQPRKMMFADSSRNGVDFSKDPHVIDFGGRYLMYYSTPPSSDPDSPNKGWGIGIAESRNLTDWKNIGYINPAAEYEAKGLCAPGALVRDGKVHLFYQTYGNWERDAICHAVSDDGINFTRDPSNPIFRPTGEWNAGRAIDAEVFYFNGKYFLYYATRDPQMKVQIQGVATASGDTDFSRDSWTQASDRPILKPELDWETNCIEAASIIERNGKLWMFYAGGYNNDPQQVGLAVSDDGINWKRVSDQPFLRNGAPGQWNHSESGHPHIFDDKRNGRIYLFYQGNNDRGKTWYISNLEIVWTDNGPEIKKPTN